MAARRSQVKVIIFPEANRRDFEGLEESVKERLDVHFVDEYEQIFELAFGYDHQKTLQQIIFTWDLPLLMFLLYILLNIDM